MFSSSNEENLFADTLKLLGNTQIKILDPVHFLLKLSTYFHLPSRHLFHRKHINGFRTQSTLFSYYFVIKVFSLCFSLGIINSIVIQKLLMDLFFESDCIHSYNKTQILWLKR